MVESAKREACLNFLQWKARNSRKLLSFSSKVTTTDGWQPKLQCLFRMRGKCKIFGFRKFPPKEAEILAKIFCSQRKVTFITERSQIRPTLLFCMLGYCELRRFRSVPPAEAGMQPKRYCFSSKVPLIVA